ncbi:hypothetical protein EC973_007413 [Apophysomyces ossiformis]|uniref:C2H2-type domain-containing protein n=1 Tax=Apophysomyces ossiformis TaxID=679940 RepID=A0A8H7BPV2_9FUNG|nr:hypothetical protein EC973_007413 [Apophysomyces ossiformis]
MDISQKAKTTNICDECDLTFDTIAKLKHHRREHTTTVYVNEVPISRTENGFPCPICDKILKSVRTFETHVSAHGATFAKAAKRSREELEDGLDALSQDKQPRLSLNVEKPSSDKPVLLRTYHDAILASCDALMENEKEKQQKIVLAQLGNWEPVSLLVEDKEYNLLASNRIVKTLVEDQIIGSWHRPDASVSNDNDCNCAKGQSEDVDSNIFHLQQTSQISHYLKSEKYVELTTHVVDLLNEDWLLYPQLRYVTSSIFAGAIMIEGNTALLINCVEPYGRLKAVDAHYERRLQKDTSSFPEKAGKYGWLKIVSSSEEGGQKLKIGTRTCNLLVTSSVRIDNGSGYAPELGPFTRNFRPSEKTKTFLDSASLASGKEMLEDDECRRVDRGRFLFQLRQLRSKFHALSSYTMCRASSTFTPGMEMMPYTVWTLFDYDCGQSISSQEKIGSRLFQVLAASVVKSGRDARLKREEVETLQDSTRAEGSIKRMLGEILGLMEGADSVPIIGNEKLNKVLTGMANVVSGGLNRANKSAVAHISSRSIQ